MLIGKTLLFRTTHWRRPHLHIHDAGRLRPPIRDPNAKCMNASERACVCLCMQRALCVCAERGIGEVSFEARARGSGICIADWPELGKKIASAATNRRECRDLCVYIDTIDFESSIWWMCIGGWKREGLMSVNVWERLRFFEYKSIFAFRGKYFIRHWILDNWIYMYIRGCGLFFLWYENLIIARIRSYCKNLWRQ